MQTRVAAICFCGVVLLAGCSKPGEQSAGTNAPSEKVAGNQSVDYHKLIVLPIMGHQARIKDPNYKAFEHAQMLCNESPTPAAEDNNPWCGAVHKAKVCATTVTILGATGPQWAAYVVKHPSPECPPK